MYRCPKCNAEFESGTKFCQNCGCNLKEEFIETPMCPTCEKMFPTGTKYCNADGTKLVPPEKMIPKCVKCGQEYKDGTKFCPNDGGQVVPEAAKDYSSRHNIDNAINMYKGANMYNMVVIILAVIAAFIDIYIVFHYSSVPFISHGYGFPLYLKHVVLGHIIVALILSGAAKLIDETLIEKEDTISKTGSMIAYIAGSLSGIFLLIAIFSKVMAGF